MSWKIGGLHPLCGEGAGSPSNKIPWDEAYLHTKWHLGHNRNAPKIGEGAPPPFGERAGSPSNIKSPRQRPTSYQVASWSMQPFGRNSYGPKIGGAVPLWEGEQGCHLIQCGQGWGLPAIPHAKFHIDPSNCLATVHQRYRQDRTDWQTDNSLIAYGEPFYERWPKTISRTQITR